MIARLRAAFSALSPGTFTLVALLIGAALLFEGWMLVLRQPFVAYRELSAAREALRAIEQMTMAQEEELLRTSARTKALAERLQTELAGPATEEQLTVSLMRRLDQAAGREGIQLTSLRPASRRHVLSFEEISFDVGAQGRYLALCQWLLNFEQSLGRFATVTDFTMKSADGGRQVALNLRLALYRPLPAGGEAK